MTLQILWSFALSSVVLALAPGPDNIFVLVQSAQYGVKRGLLCILGLCLGICLQVTCVILGITAVILASPNLLLALKIAGAAYLSYLAFLSFKYAKNVHHIELNNQTKTYQGFAMIRRGLIMNVSNPKVQLFFLSFFPQFIPATLQGSELSLAIASLGAIFALATLVVFGAIALMAGTLASYFSSPKFNLCLNLTSGTIFIGLALFTLLGI